MLEDLGAIVAGSPDAASALALVLAAAAAIIGIRRYGARHERRTRTGS